jgi:methionyl-tRNA formyltransferase
VSTNDAYIELTEVKPQSKASMSAEAFVNGYAQFNPKIVF